ncbi:short chain dehydrogenase, putative [Theileria annulata]|uniref:Short chain dehydrogenase, putative n=1 Tax=Theileria annulata TaxID=5874 RepID=Q4UHI9_THEAN|nr:short chain dehydrogenase, putative [Theileria annulata]CAI73450.1 short chain dehydrogenase, putative [Theileria annulata]|eukprot:XP_954127.1 short chain dehydrogenase, putative [Theileria annulata]
MSDIKAVVVTGCDSGIGYGICATLFRKNYFVIAGCNTKYGFKKVKKLFKSISKSQGVSSDSPSRSDSTTDSMDISKHESNNFDQNVDQEKNNTGNLSDQLNSLNTGKNVYRIGTRGILVRLDVTNEESVKELASLVQELIDSKQIPSLYSLINNSGIWRFSTLKECWNDDKLIESEVQDELARWKLVMETNLMGSVRVTLRLVPFLTRYKGLARVIFITSVVDETGVPGQSSYVSSKFAIRGFHECLMHELEGTNICTVCVAPGALSDTRLFDYDFNLDKEYRLNNTHKLKNGMKILKKLASSSRGVVKTVMKALESKRPRRYYRSTSGTFLFKLVKLLPKSLYIKVVKLILMNFEHIHTSLPLLTKLIRLILK